MNAHTPALWLAVWAVPLAAVAGSVAAALVVAGGPVALAVGAAWLTAALPVALFALTASGGRP